MSAMSLLEAARFGLDAMEAMVAGTLETACMLDESLRPIRSTLPEEDESVVARLENDVERVRAAIEAAEAELEP